MMTDLSFVEKLKLLVDVSSSSRMGIIGIFILVLMSILFLTTTAKNAKVKRITFMGIYFILFGILLWQYQSSLGKMFDYMMNHFFIVFYFPNVAIYLAAIIATNIILFISIFNFKEDRLIKVLNTIAYGIIHYFLILILNVIHEKKLDVFSQTSIYGNDTVAALINLTSIVFMVWIIFLIIYKIIRKTQVKENTQEVETKIETKYVEVPVRIANPNIRPITIPNVVRGNSKKSKKTIQNIPIPFFIRGKSPSFPTITQYIKMPVKKMNPNILTLTAPSLVYDYRHPKEVKKEPLNHQQQLAEIESMLTLEDYKIVLDILNNHRDLAHENQVSTEKNIIEESNSLENHGEEEYFPTKLDELLNL